MHGPVPPPFASDANLASAARERPMPRSRPEHSGTLRHAARVTSTSERLAEERARTVHQIRSLQRSFEEIVAATADVATDDEHDPEGHTIAWERQQVATLLEEARTRLAELDLAIRRVEGGDYGRCEVCGRPIPDERLDVLPTASTCVDCAT